MADCDSDHEDYETYKQNLYKENMANYSVLSDVKIKEYLDCGEIVIEPFNNKNLNPTSYDVTLGEWYFREQPRSEYEHEIYNIYSENDVKRVWGNPLQARKIKDIYNQKLENIKPTNRAIFIHPGETILAHTNEYIGGKNNVTTMMKARSSIGRNFIKTCSDAGWGDAGYINRWTMEITNTSKHYTIPLIVGRRLAQIVFFETDGVAENYGISGKYQVGTDLNELKLKWKPEDMLPKMYNDFEVTK